MIDEGRSSLAILFISSKGSLNDCEPKQSKKLEIENGFEKCTQITALEAESLLVERVPHNAHPVLDWPSFTCKLAFSSKTLGSQEDHLHF